MSAHEFTEQRSVVSRIEGLLTWLGGGHYRELGERHERSMHSVAGAVVLLGAGLAWLIATLAVQAAVSGVVSIWVTVALTLVVGLLVGAVTRGIASGPARGRSGLASRAAVAIAVGVVVGELAALVVFSGAIDHRLDEQALRTADSAPAVAQASTSLQQAREARGALDNSVEQARGHRDKALVVARCEYNPSPSCPQTRITGVPGRGPETRTANEQLADAQRELDNALASRDRQAPGLDATVSRDQQALNAARDSVIANAGHSLGARWVTMNDLTVTGPGASAGALVLRVLTLVFFTLLYLLPLILRTWRGETSHDRNAAARAEKQRAELDAERAELDADTAIAIKRAEVRREAEIMWAEHQLAQTRVAIEAQAQIDREQQRRRVVEALEAPVRALSERTFEPVEEDMYLPIAAEAEAASRALVELPVGKQYLDAQVEEAPEYFPTPIQQPAQAVDRYQAVERYEAPEEPQEVPREVPREVEVANEERAPLIPSIPDATKAAVRWIRPLMPPFIARVIDNTTQPFRSRQEFEEVEEINFSLKRSRKVTVNSESSDGGGQQQLQQQHPPQQVQQVPQGQPQQLRSAAPATRGNPPAGPTRIESSRGEAARENYTGNYEAGNYGAVGGGAEQASLGQMPPPDLTGLSAGRSGRHGRRELVERDGPPELVERDGPRGLDAPQGPRQLPPAK